ncbi:ATP-grasp domain-containing protein [Vibrio breoganii]|uniref:ATP-grasp domain-containing protein n=1 Tax=Vibrio breoganii TaxID=553239 RepID=UPI000C81A41B|nr:ATP-grasp domain-containing protein [Vibrio breoganii]PMG94752.1 hypothetical protein BCU80_06145 [Vibrio breoganii]
MVKWVVHVGAGDWQLAAIKETQRRGYSVLALDGNESAIGLAHADQTLVVNITDELATLTAVKALFSTLGTKPVAVLCIASEAGQLSAGLLRDHFCLPGLNYDTAHRLTDKSLQRKLWEGESFSPEYAIIQIGTDATPNANSLPPTVIVKPVDSAGSRGITVLENFNQNELTEAITFAGQYSRSQKVIIERYIVGQEYTLESVVIDGETHALVITEKNKVQGTYGTVANKLASAQLSQSDAESVIHTISEGHKRLNYRNGVSHAEVIIDNDGQVWIVEIAGRGAGFAVSEKYIEFCTGYPYLFASIDFNISGTIKKPHKINVLPSCIRFFECGEGILEEFYIPHFNNVESASLLPIGAVMKRATTDGDRIGYAMVKGETQQQFEALLKQVEEAVKVKIRVK